MNPERSAGTDAATDLVRVTKAAAELSRAIAAASAGLLSLVAAVLLWRRLAGALASPLEPAALALVGLLVATAAAVVRTAGRYWPAQKPAGPLGWCMAAVLSTAVVVVGIAASVPRTSLGGLVVFWGVLAAEECWAWVPAGWRRLLAARRRSPTRGLEARIDRPPFSKPRAAGFDLESNEPPASDVMQQLTRRRGADGSESLSGWLRVPMAAGQRSASVHVAFCPPFLRTPAVTVAQLEGPEARIKTVQVLPYGARFDLKLAAFRDNAATVLLTFSAQAVPPAGPSTESPPHRAETDSEE